MLRLMFRASLVAISLLLSGPSLASAQGSSTFVTHARVNAQPAHEYVVAKFTEHDVVFLGEGPHFVRQNLEFVQALIPRLHAAGVYNLCLEMINAKEQAKLDQLLLAEEYDEALAGDLIFDWRLIHGAFTEYAEILRAAWQVNRNLPKGAHKFRIVALDVPTQAYEWSQLRDGEKGGREALSRLLEGNWVDRGEMQWAQLIASQVLNRGEKALVYAGSGHTSTRFYAHRNSPKNSVHAPHYRTAGNLIYDYIGERAFRISLHASEDGAVVDLVDGWMAAFVAAGGASQIGFDVRPGTPVGDIASNVKRGYLPDSAALGPYRVSDFVLGHVTDGYVFLTPRSQFKVSDVLPVTAARLQEYNRREQIRAGDRNLAPKSREQLERMLNQYHEQVRADIER